MDVLAELKTIGVIPAIVLNRPEDALPLGKALMAGGLPCTEITFRTDAAEEGA